MTNIQTDGVVLDATPYQDSHHITTLFTSELGLARLFVRGTLRPRHHSHALVTPLTRGDFLLSSGKNSLFRLRDGSITHPYLALRESRARLETACAMARTLLSTQYPLKPAPALYQLFTRYLDALTTAATPSQFLASFTIKLIKHEGLLALEPLCQDCGSQGDIFWNMQGVYCSFHAPADAISLSHEEWDLVQSVAHSRNFSEMLPLSPELSSKIKSLIH